MNHFPTLNFQVCCQQVKSSSIVRVRCLCTCEIVFKGGRQNNPGLQAEQDTGTQIPSYKVERGKGHQGLKCQVGSNV